MNSDEEVMHTKLHAFINSRFVINPDNSRGVRK